MNESEGNLYNILKVCMQYFRKDDFLVVKAITTSSLVMYFLSHTV
jgi:hypothetical protein